MGSNRASSNTSNNSSRISDNSGNNSENFVAAVTVVMEAQGIQLKTELRRAARLTACTHTSTGTRVYCVKLFAG
jgi:hypothetical protein